VFAWKVKAVWGVRVIGRAFSCCHSEARSGEAIQANVEGARNWIASPSARNDIWEAWEREFPAIRRPGPFDELGTGLIRVHREAGRWRAGGCRNRSGMTVLGIGAGGIRLRPRPSGSQQSITLLEALRRGDELGVRVGDVLQAHVSRGLGQASVTGAVPPPHRLRGRLRLGLGSRSPGRCPQSLAPAQRPAGGCGTDRVALLPLEVIPPASPA
jgi:hypothetical protein